MRLAFRCSFLPFLLIALWVVSPTVLLGQGPAAAPNPDASSNKAIIVVQAALLAMQSHPVGRSDIRGTIQDEKGAQKGTFDWQTTGHESQFEVHRGDHVNVFNTNSGKPKQSRDGKDPEAPFHQLKAIIPVHLPGSLLLQESNDQRWAFEYVGQEFYVGISAWHIRLVDQSDDLAKLISEQDWWFDVNTGLPLKLETRMPLKENAKQHETDITRYLEWSPSSAGMIPSKLSKCESDSCQSIFRVESVDITAGGQQ